MKKEIIKILQKALKEKDVDLKEEEILAHLEVPPSHEMGDYSFPCFFLASKLKEDPKEIALEVRANIGDAPKEFSDIQTKAGYINFFVDRNKLAANVIYEILSQKDKFGSVKLEKPQKTIVEFPSPNTNKPLHLGHLRNMAIGESVSKILEFNGEKVLRVNLNNDRGIHICKSMATYQMFGKNKKPGKIKSDHFVGEFYVMFNKKVAKNKKLEIESHRLLQKWEQGDKSVLALWKKMNKWALEGFKQTYKKFGVEHDFENYESEHYKKGREIIINGLKEGIFSKKKDGAIFVNLEKEKLGEKILLRSDGTSVYITQDIYLAKSRYDKFKTNKMIYVVGNEQNYHFDVLFNVLKKLKFDFVEQLYHLSHGMVNLPEGRMKSREGTIVDADDLINKVQELVKKELKSRYKLSKKELEERSLKIALAAIKYFLLRVDMKKNMMFNPKESINFEGETGPYIQYAYARASGILKKVKVKKKKELEIKKLEPKELELVKKLSMFPEVVANAYKTLNPSLIANYTYQLAQLFNEFYQFCFVIGSEQENFRLKLVESFRYVLKNATGLLGIDVLESM